MNNKLFIPLALIIAGVLIAGAVVYTNYSKSQCKILEGEISAEESSNKVMDFINNNLLISHVLSILSKYY